MNIKSNNALGTVSKGHQQLQIIANYFRSAHHIFLGDTGDSNPMGCISNHKISNNNHMLNYVIRWEE